MKIKTLGLFVLAASFVAAGAMAQDNPAPAGTPSAGQTGKMSKEQKKAEWEAGIKQDCAAEIGTGGVCAGKDFGSGLMECLHKNHKSLSDGCKVAVHKHHHGMMGKKGMGKGNQSEQTPNAPAPTNPPSNQ